MKVIKSKILYGTKKLNKSAVCCPSAKVGKIVPNAGSIYNKTAQTKISSATQTLDLLLTNKEYFSYSDPISKLLVFEYGKDLFLTDGSRIKTTSAVSDDGLILATDILCALSLLSLNMVYFISTLQNYNYFSMNKLERQHFRAIFQYIENSFTNLESFFQP
jgi:hypothetical protein